MKNRKIMESLLKNNLENINKINYISELLKLPKFLKAVDSRLKSLPFHLEKPYTFSKWLMYENKVSNTIVK